MKVRHIALSACACVLLLGAAACEPPGKPKEEELNRREITDFATLYSDNCQGCHGPDGKNGPARPLNDALYLAIIPKPWLQDIITHGRPGTAMPAWALSQGGPLTDKQVSALVDGIESHWAKPVDFGGVPAPAYTAGAASGHPDHGKKLFVKDCFACHGQGAPIGPVTDPTYLSLVSDQLLRTAIIEGRPDFGMPDYRSINAGHALSDQDITDLVAFLVSKRPITPNVQNLNVNSSGAGQSGPMVKGNEGSGNGPGSSRFQQNENNKGTGSSSQRGVK
jgi:cytochrome c oxidase cbb3-type subunit 3/ubiquinol-cytochrome c reductase cytochrome c subunit